MDANANAPGLFETKAVQPPEALKTVGAAGTLAIIERGTPVTAEAAVMIRSAPSVMTLSTVSVRTVQGGYQLGTHGARVPIQWLIVIHVRMMNSSQTQSNEFKGEPVSVSF